MIKYIAKRLLISLMILFLGSLLLFVLVINSGDPLAALRESNDPNRENQMAQMTKRMGLDKSWYERYWDWLSGMLRGNFGVASDGSEVNALVLSAASSTLRMVVLASLLAITIGITMGVLTAVRQYSGFDYAVTMMAFVFFSLPVFWFAVLLKHYAAIEFNNWIAKAQFTPPMLLGIAVFLGLVIAAIVGGPWKRRIITFGVLAVAFAGVMTYFNATTWFRSPVFGLPVYILLVLGVGCLMVVLTSGFGNKGVRNAVAATALVAIVGYGVMRGVLMTNPSYLLLLGLLAVAIGVGVLAGRLLGGFSRRQATFASVVTGILASLAALIDLLLSNWAAYLKLQPRPIPTIGSATANFSTTWWGHNIDLLTHIFLPTMALMLISLASYTRYTRASMLEVLNQDYIRTARSKGISERKVITRHALRNSLIPLATILAFDFAGLIGGAVITERVFGWQGMGAMFASGLAAVDPTRVMAFYAVTGTAAVTMNMLADITYAFLDPRISR
ncbi:ABC transporter permease [Arachnia propionica]|uniref:ABC transporter permease n=1 Tax=Arachnia propionica TaxID=1750 RepID=A0A3P1WWB6_9ACTN|nr:ABC transporter permease [Arachnia propionica]RRD49700.1 ABC transporter permease [Arachnia propionica]